MKIFKIILIIVAVIVALFVIVSAVMPDKFDVKREIVIKAPADFVFNQINDFSQMKNWSPWQEMDTAMTITIEGELGQPGYKYSWSSVKRDVGQGSLTRTMTEKNKSITNDLYFVDFDMKSNNYWYFEENAEGIKVTWGDAGDIPFLARAFMGFMNMDKLMGADFEKGLGKLKDYCEKKSNAETAIKIEIVNTDNIEYLAIRAKADTSNIGEVLGQCYGQIGDAMKKQKLEFAGAPFAIYYSESEINFDFDAAVPVNRKGNNDGNVKAGLLPAMKAVVANHYGPYENTPAAHAAISNYLDANKLRFKGPVWESYENDPTTVKSPSEILTKVYYGIE